MNTATLPRQLGRVSALAKIKKIKIAAPLQNKN
jgi:hypothetical protein